MPHPPAQCDIAIIGAGAAGLSAAIFAAQTALESGHPATIFALDGAKSIGAKILVSGGGRCNITHDHIHIDDYNGSRNIVRNILAAFDEHATVRWFESMGVQLKREQTGKLFPTSDSAKLVLSLLLRRCDELGIHILTNHRVHNLIAPPDPTAPFTILHEHGQSLATRVILATGGRSLPRTGSDGQAWEIVRRLGHTVTDTYPALVPLVLDDSFFHSQLSGQSLEVELSTFANRKLVDRRRGSLLWTHFGISGPAVMDASRHWVIAQARGQNPQMKCSLLPGQTLPDVEQWLIHAASRRPRHAIATVLRDKLPDRLATTLASHLAIDPQLPAAQLPRDLRRRLSLALVELDLPILRDRGWNYAEVTAGGVPLAEIDYRTMESRKLPRLHLIGEMLDCDGRIGGFNFQWAWSTAHIAALAAAHHPSPSSAT